MNRKLISIVALMIGLPAYTQADPIADLQNEFQSAGAGKFSAVAGETFWKTEFIDAKSGQKRSCATCHTTDLQQTGKHVKTGKAIEPMAPAVNTERFSDIKKINKWFLRNCKWTVGRECTVQEKGDVLAFIKNF